LAAFFKRPVSELDISYEEFMHWLAYLELEPPDYGATYRTALVLERITNMSGKSVKKPVKVDDFMPKAPVIEMAQTIDEQKAFLRSIRGE
jgi:hypothetical protein